MPLTAPFSLDLPSKYKIHELIFVNSGSNYYVRLPVDTHAALLSDNNSGKTSTLSALKLFVLPEVSFKNSKTKFGFASGGKFYSDIDSFQYYFPGTESYIVCNASNPKGSFCWVLYRTTNFGYERIAVPKSFDTIEHLFWNADSPKNENAGQLQPDIGISDIKKKLLNKDCGGKIFTDRNIIGEAIYTRTSNADNHTRFSLIPMAKKFTLASVETVRALFGMAFSLGDASTSTLPIAISSIIDGMGMSVVKKNEDGVFLDLDNALEEWRDLKAMDVKLLKIASLKDKWKLLQAERARYARLKSKTNNDFKLLVWAIQYALDTLKEKMKVARVNAEKAEAGLSLHRMKFSDIEGEYKQCSSDLKAAHGIVKGLEERVKLVEFVRGHMQPLCPENDKTDGAVLNALDNEIHLCGEEIHAFEDRAKAIKTMETLNNSIHVNKNEVEELKSVLANIEEGNSFLSHLSSHAAATLISLNANFSLLDITPTPEQRSNIEMFSTLFTNEDGRLVFCSSPMRRTTFHSLDAGDVKENTKKRLKTLDDQINTDQKQLLKLNQNTSLTKTDQELKLKVCREDLSELKKQRSALKGIDEIQSMLEDSIETVGNRKNKLEIKQVVYDEVKEKLRSLRIEFNELTIDVQNLAVPLDTIESNRKNLEYIEIKSSRMLNLSEALLEYDSNLESKIPTAGFRGLLDELGDNLIETQDSRTNCINNLCVLVESGIVESTPEDRHSISIKREIFDAYYSALQTLYENLDRSRENFKERLSAHNNTAATSARMIENMKSIIENFIHGINQELSGYQVSNLDKVELVADLHPQYTSMVKTLAYMSNKTDSLLSEDFYKQIADFQNRFYILKSGKIDISKIIERISYRFDRNGKMEAIPQSNGTNCMVNAVLLALLLKRMVPEDLSLAMPVIFDEVGSLDERNLREVLKVMDEHGLVLFAANPESTGVIASVLEVYHDLSIFKATDVEVQGKAESIYFSGMEERLEEIVVDVEEAEKEQNGEVVA